MAFGRLTRPQGQRPFSDINMTPLIDVMLVLLIIFMVTAPLLTARLPLDLPKANAPLAATPPATTKRRPPGGRSWAQAVMARRVRSASWRAMAAWTEAARSAREASLLERR